MCKYMQISSDDIPRVQSRIGVGFSFIFIVVCRFLGLMPSPGGGGGVKGDYKRLVITYSLTGEFLRLQQSI